MNAAEKNRLSKEAELQMKALGQIGQWKKTALALSAVGVAFTYAGWAGESPHLFLGICGMVLIVLGAGSAAVLNLGIRNGRRNVEKIVNVLEMNKP